MTVSALTVALVLTSGVLAGIINTIVGSGTLLTFPVLVASGLPPVLANMSNTVGLVAGNFSGAYGYRHELRGQLHRITLFGIVSLLGAIVGAVGLVILPASAFNAAVPALVLIASLLVMAQPWLKKRLSRSAGTVDRCEGETRNGEQGRWRTVATEGGPLLWTGIFAAGVYGGYFGAAAGVVLLALFGLLLNENIQRLNGIKNICIGVINAVAAILFILIAPIAWLPALLLMAGSLLGGQIGARVARRMPPAVLRACVVAIGLTAATVLIVRYWL
ncbi:sulfite exporter TauE/SafE family protein [Streptomyces chrestomyceticus]|uniref:sulfite exporter TauE/SafE family protein n=1 Tax=Streptomyces chrestomyceticus TaxID=68185 RepID=UPI0019D19225|nr:sulfite exporter TauE/SafE family protein [Streptomyces chrestomyceticus]